MKFLINDIIDIFKESGLYKNEIEKEKEQENEKEKENENKNNQEKENNLENVSDLNLLLYKRSSSGNKSINSISENLNSNLNLNSISISISCSTEANNENSENKSMQESNEIIPTSTSNSISPLSNLGLELILINNYNNFSLNTNIIEDLSKALNLENEFHEIFSLFDLPEEKNVYLIF